MTSASITWAIAALTALGIVVRPFRWPEAVWAMAGAALLAALQVIDAAEIGAGIAKGYDVYLFLIGMMLLSELARIEGLFDWIASVATTRAKGSPARLFVLVYIVGIIVTVFLSNDATAVVLTPAVYAACKAAKVKDPMPYLLICAFIANAASFVLPISNPANLVIFAGGDMPPLGRWVATFAAPSAVAIAATFAALWWTQRRSIREDTVATVVDQPHLPASAKMTGVGLAVTAVILVVASSKGFALGMPTCAAALLTTLVVALVKREFPLDPLKGISWSVLPLVAGLFVIVQALDKTGLTEHLAGILRAYSTDAPALTATASGILAAVVSNLVNNLPAGLVAGGAVQAAQVSDKIAGAVLIGIDLGPNLSVTGSLATILWLNALRREGLSIGAWQFLKIGTVVMFPALFLSLAALLLVGS